MSGLWALRHIADRGTSILGSRARCAGRFSRPPFARYASASNQAHGRGVAVQLNHSLDLGAVIVARDGTFSVVQQRMVDAVTD
jgi:hypothetical protein